VAEEKKQTEKTLEMRVAELEDKLAQIHITEEEMRAYHKVSNLLRGQPAGPVEPPGGTPGPLSPQVGTVLQCAPCVVYAPYPALPHPHPCYVEYCAFGAPLPGISWGGRFRGFGY
jgi:hypothetical protein